MLRREGNHSAHEWSKSPMYKRLKSLYSRLKQTDPKKEVDAVLQTMRDSETAIRPVTPPPPEETRAKQGGGQGKQSGHRETSHFTVYLVDYRRTEDSGPDPDHRDRKDAQAVQDAEITNRYGTPNTVYSMPL